MYKRFELVLPKSDQKNLILGSFSVPKFLCNLQDTLSITFFSIDFLILRLDTKRLLFGNTTIIRSFSILTDNLGKIILVSCAHSIAGSWDILVLGRLPGLDGQSSTHNYHYSGVTS